MVEVELIGVPFDGYGRRGRQAAAAGVLVEVGLAASASAVTVSELDLPRPDPARGPRTSLINEDALVAMSEALDGRVAGSLAEGRFPVVHGADCTTLLGIVPALEAVEPTGLLFYDGHEDTMPLDVSEDGEAANAEIGLLLGLTGGLLQGPLRRVVGTLDPRRLAVLGPRDEAWRRRFNVGSLREVGVWLRDWRETAASPETCARDAVGHVGQASSRWWLHVDLDVVDPVEFPAQGLPDVPDDPDGLTWDELTRSTTAAVAEGGCVGLSVAIYDPEQDPDRSGARRVVRLVTDVVGALRRSG